MFLSHLAIIIFPKPAGFCRNWCTPDHSKSSNYSMTPTLRNRPSTTERTMVVYQFCWNVLSTLYSLLLMRNRLRTLTKMSWRYGHTSPSIGTHRFLRMGLHLGNGIGRYLSNATLCGSSGTLRAIPAEYHRLALILICENSPIWVPDFGTSTTATSGPDPKLFSMIKLFNFICFVIFII